MKNPNCQYELGKQLTISIFLTIWQYCDTIFVMKNHMQRLYKVTTSLVPTARGFFVSSEFSLEGRNDIDILALLIKSEAGSEPLRGQAAVACVPFTRVSYMPWRYGRDVRSAMLKPKAFSCFNDLAWVARFWPVEEHYYTLARMAEASLIANPAPGATHYYNPDISQPYWRHEFKHIATIGDHVFMRESK